MPRFEVSATGLAGLKLVQRQLRVDSRGFFSRFFCAEELRLAGFAQPVAQINHTLTRQRGTVRGMHFQHPPHGEDKLVSCLRGEIFDVAVDLRRDSPTFLQWHAEVLSSENGRSLLIPKGFAHGFQTLDDDTELLYLHSTPYVQSSEGGLNPADPALAIDWPLPLGELSARDAGHALLTPEFRGV
ncbi:dTDP-4-dehydrorhamnose 3,5-epimerase family protein [Variovorax sp. J22P271]|uniref:dTDP-4-dehydrorhamnose 3,5-epimerase family protein n=1 Tax=Variovorax davisae TaxID=3053515 RepID=UPI00257503CC|nr:dTDP-4-dehydrorhamnose 3,5-epimerase family protein [Variovorax sp. J22P271]MDM0033296.1 dTDP-4-dehydrorhamnose 3,5-epimerase family protein [Variovorax sp. J22P271]